MTRLALEQLSATMRAQVLAKIDLSNARKVVGSAGEHEKTGPKVKPKRRTEHQEQAAVCDWWKLSCESYGLPEFALFAIPNSAKRSFRLAAMLKAEGMRAGIPDLCLAAMCPRDPRAGALFIEMKRKPNKPTPEQTEVIDYLRRAGYHCVIAWNFEEARTAIEAYLKKG